MVTNAPNTIDYALSTRLLNLGDFFVTHSLQHFLSFDKLATYII